MFILIKYINRLLVLPLLLIDNTHGVQDCFKLCFGTSKSDNMMSVPDET